MSLIRAKLQGQVLQELKLIEGSEYLIGRSRVCDIYLDESKEISRRHVKISQDENGQWVAQLMARFGELIVNGQSTNHVALKDSLSFHMSPYDIEFVIKATVVDQPESSLTPQSLVPADLQISEGPAPQPMAPQANNDQNPSALPAHQESPHPHKGPPLSVDNPYGTHSPPSYDKNMNDEITADGISNQLVAYLEILWEDRPKESMALEGKRWTVGRSPSCEITISERYISRKQFKIKKRNNTFYISDLGSSNGTLLNGEPLPPKKLHPLGSHDIISARELKIKFLIRNHALGDNPSPESSNPLVPISGSQLTGKENPNVVRISSKSSLKLNPRKKVISIAVAACVVLATYGWFSRDSKAPPLPTNMNDLSSEGENSISHLPVDQQMVIKDIFNLSRTHYTQGNYELCLSEVKKLHQLIPFYENSKEIMSLCEQGQMLIMKEREKERRQQAARELREKVNVIIQRCKNRMNRQMTLAELESCLSEARESDPSHPQISELMTQMKVREQQRTDNLRRQAQYQKRIQQGIHKYNVAKQTYKHGNLSSAIKAYQQYLSSPFPDPKNLKGKAKRELASLKRKLNEKVSQKIGICQKALKNQKYKQAVRSCETAIAEGPV